MVTELHLPEDVARDLETAISILKASGCHSVYVFGSFAAEDYAQNSDLDIAVEGLSKSLYFKTYGQLLARLSRDIDLVGLDYDTEFAETLRELGPLKRVA
jgi:predicted nucleotidyltransferase